MRAGSPTAIQPSGTVAPAGRTVRRCTMALMRTSAARPIRAPLKTVAPVAMKASLSTMQPVRQARGPTITFSAIETGWSRTPRTTAVSMITQFLPIVTLPLSAVITAPKPTEAIWPDRHIPTNHGIRRDAGRCVDGGPVPRCSRIISFSFSIINAALDPPLATS